jgi:hypothetical protein
MTKRRFRHCMSRSAASSMYATLPTPERLRARFAYDVPRSGQRPAVKVATKVLQNAGRSSGLRLDTTVFGPREQTTTSSSTQLAPALTRSVRRLGHDVIIRPRTTSASIIVHGAWQMAAIDRAAARLLLTDG